jgi:hypothetical protein
MKELGCFTIGGSLAGSCILEDEKIPGAAEAMNHCP